MAGEWLEADYQRQLSDAANTAAGRLFGGSASGGGSAEAGRRQQADGGLTPEWS